MSVKLQSSSGGSVEIAAPVTASNYTLTAPATNGTILNDVSSLAAANLAGNVDVARLVSAFSGGNVSLAANGYQKLPSGLIIQWGSGIYANAATVTFPVAFPAMCASVVSSVDAYSVSGVVEVPEISNISVSSFKTQHQRVDGLGYTGNVWWLAIGY